MSNTSKDNVKSTEVTVAFVKGALSAVPVVGGLLVEVGSLLFDPLKKREEAWKQSVTDAIAYLSEHGNIDVDKLKDNELFVSLILQASAQARKTHQKEKLKALRNIIANGTATLDTSEDLLFVFLGYIEELTPTHFAILRFMQDLSDRNASLKSYEDFYQRYMVSLGQDLSRPHFKLCCDDLGMRKLAHLIGMDSGFDDITGEASKSDIDNHAQVLVTQIGRQFLRQINTPTGLTDNLASDLQKPNKTVASLSAHETRQP